MIQEQPSKAWIPVTAAIITGACAVIAAIVTLGAPFADRAADRYFPITSTPAINNQQQAPTQAAANPPTQKVIVVTATLAPQMPSSQGFSTQDLDSIFGSGKWHCVDGFPKAVSIDSVPSNFIVQLPFVRVDKNDMFYYPGETVPSGGYATGWLESNLPNSNCSSIQPNIAKSDIDTLVGSGNWSCLAQYPTGVLVRNVPANFVVSSPAIYVDKNDVRYYKGEEVSSGGAATVWFSNEIPSSECP